MTDAYSAGGTGAGASTSSISSVSDGDAPLSQMIYVQVVRAAPYEDIKEWRRSVRVGDLLRITGPFKNDEKNTQPKLRLV